MYYQKKKFYSTNSNNYKKPYNPNYVRKPFVKVENTYGYNKNAMITSPTVIVIDIEGKNLGEMNIADAIALAKEYEYDLVEVSPNAKPPVCKIVEWEKFRYELQKKKQQPKTNVEIKGMWFGVNVGEGDLKHKVDRILEFIHDKHPVKIEVRAKGGRQVPNIFQTVMKKILDSLENHIRLDSEPKFEGAKKYTCIVYPKLNKK